MERERTGAELAASLHRKAARANQLEANKIHRAAYEKAILEGCDVDQAKQIADDAEDAWWNE